MRLQDLIKEIRWLIFTIERKLKVRWHSAKRLFISPNLPISPDGKIRVHLGCGDVIAPGFINVDLKPASHIHYLHSISDLPFFQDVSVDLIYACHVLEHFPFEMVSKVLWEWRRVLKVGGILRLSVPDFDLLLNIYHASNNNVESIRQPLLGIPDGYYSHLQLFNFRYIKELLENNGFTAIKFWNPNLVEDHNFEDWASRPILYKDQPYPISLNVEAIKR